VNAPERPAKISPQEAEAFVTEALAAGAILPGMNRAQRRARPGYFKAKRQLRKGRRP
jgi:hypothetical protein